MRLRPKSYTGPEDATAKIESTAKKRLRPNKDIAQIETSAKKKVNGAKEATAKKRKRLKRWQRPKRGNGIIKNLNGQKKVAAPLPLEAALGL
jgi:hypothetical protein